MLGRTMYFGDKLLILDEPMTALSVKVDKCHVYPAADRFVILDKGLKTGELDKKEVAAEDIIEIIAKGMV